MAEGRRSAEAIEGELQELRALLLQVDPLRTLGALHMFDAFRRGSVPGPANFGSDAMLELLATAICAEDEIAALGRIDREFEPQLIWTIEQVLNRIANHMATVETGRVVADWAGGESSPLMNMLRLENAFDRMAGFDPHVRRVVTTVFSTVDERARQNLGFTLSDSLSFASLYGQVRLLHADKANLVMANFDAPRSFANQEEQIRWAAAHMTFYALNSAPPLEGGALDGELANQLKLDEEKFAALVEAMSTKLGSVDSAKVLSDTSVRTRPLLRLSSGEWMWARPIDFVHGAMEWALEVCKADQKLSNTSTLPASRWPRTLLRTCLTKLSDVSMSFGTSPTRIPNPMPRATPLCRSPESPSLSKPRGSLQRPWAARRSAARGEAREGTR